MTTLFEETGTRSNTTSPFFERISAPAEPRAGGNADTQRSNAALRRTARRYRTMLQGVQAGVIVYGADSTVTAFNAKAIELLGMTASQMTACGPNDPKRTYVNADGSPLGEAELPYRRAFATLKPERDFILGVDRPAQRGFVWLLMSAHPVLAASGSIAEVIVTFMDVTARLQAERSGRSSEKRFKALFEQAAVGVAQIDVTTGRFVQINQRFCEIVGRSRQEMEPLTFAAITHPQDVAGDAEAMRQLCAGTIREFTREKRYLRKDGSAVWVNLTVSAMWALGEAPDHGIAVAQDITRRKRLEEQLRQAQKMDAMGTLAGGIAHDFNNILASINGYTELARMVLQGNPVVRDYLGCVLQASSRATDLVRQILAFSRQEQVERRPIQLQSVVAETLKLLRALIPSTIEFEISLAPDAPTVLADATQIHQVLMNLGTNACHAMKDRPGRLQVKLERCVVDETHAVSEARLQPGVYARVSVSDTGCGMDPATVARIFDPFFTTKAPGEGTGLGLAVVHGIMGSHDGAVTVYSHLGEGTVFHAYFPAEASEPVAAMIEAEAIPRGHGERILLVDDEEPLVRLGQKTLTMLGYDVEVATQSTAAVAMVRADPQRFALVLTDQTMPGMTGLILADELRKIRPELPVLLMSGYSLSLTRERVEAAGIRKLLLKPISLHALGNAVHTALAVHSPR